MFLDGLVEEGLVSRGSDEPAPEPGLVDEHRSQSGNTQIVERTYRHVGNGAPGDFTAAGIPERALPV